MGGEECLLLDYSQCNVAGPPEVEEECGTPVLCMFYALLCFIICLTIYSTVKGTKE